MTFSGGSNFPSPPHLMFDFSNVQLILLLLLSRPRLTPPACLKHGCYIYLPWTAFVSFSHSTAPNSCLIPSECLELFLASLCLCYTDQLCPSAPQQPNFTFLSLSFVAQNIEEVLCLLLL